MNIYAVEQRAADALLIANNSGGRTRAFFDGIGVIATRTPVWLAVAPGIWKKGRLCPSAHCSRCNSLAVTTGSQGLPSRLTGEGMKWIDDGKAMLSILVIRCSWQFVQMGKPGAR